MDLSANFDYKWAGRFPYLCRVSFNEWKHVKSFPTFCETITSCYNQSSFSESGASDNFCSRTYKGPSAASEPETKAIQKELKRLGPSLRAVIGMRDLGFSWNFPWPKGQNLDNMDDKTKTEVKQNIHICFISPSVLELPAAEGCPGPSAWTVAIHPTGP